MAGLTDVRGAVAVVTGASSGIGEALARELADRGARVALVARRGERLDAIADALRRAGRDAHPFACDIRDAEAVAATGARVRRDCGDVDLLCNGAGLAHFGLFADQDPAQIRDMMLTNYMGSVLWIQQVLPAMRRRRKGWIVNISSLAGRIGQAGEAAYSASKFAVTGLSQGLAQELAPLGIGVLCVHPSLVRTELFTPEVLERVPGSSPRFIEPDDFARRTLKALARGRTDAVVPRRMRGPIVLSALFPEFMSKAVGRVKRAALRKAGDPV